MVGRIKIGVSEHTLQAQISSILNSCKVPHFETDVMSGLQYFNHTDPRRFAFISHHKKIGYKAGQPDLVVLFKGKVFFVELKTKKGKQSKEQKEFAKILQEHGYTYLVWRSLDDCINFLRGEK